MRAVREPDIWSARIVVEEDEVRVIGELRARVEPAMRYWDCAFGVMVSVPMVRGAARSVPVAEGKRDALGP